MFRELTVRLQRADRRRLAFASALTVFALPAVWLANRDNAPTRPNVAAVGLAAESASGRAAEAPPRRADPMGVPDPLFPDEDPPPPAPADVSIAVGSTEGPILGTPLATYSRSVVDDDSCPYDGVVAGTTVTVVNPANGRSVECVTTSSDGDELVLHPDRFVLLADLTSGPIPVEIHAG
jgi:hypothetical protein